MKNVLSCVALAAGILCGCGGETVTQEQEAAVSAVIPDVYIAAKENNLELVRQFVQMGQWDHVVPDAEGMTVLHYAAMHGNVEMIRLLLDNGASHTVHNTRGQTPLQVAEAAGKTEAAAFLRDRGAN